MRKHQRLPFVAVVFCVLLPYGVNTFDTAFFTTIQAWMFPFWYYIHDFGQWLGFGRIIPVFIDPMYPLPLVLLGLLWFILGLSTSMLLHALYLDQIQQRSAILLLLGGLVSQLIITHLVFLYVLDYIVGYTIPLPIHTLLVLLLIAFVPERSID
ncbi:MAG: hypothetical protein ACW97A_11945 [Candidatus Thorarchaeota archaeon]